MTEANTSTERVRSMHSIVAALSVGGAWLATNLLYSGVSSLSKTPIVLEGFVQFAVYLGVVLAIRRVYMPTQSFRESVGLRMPPLVVAALAIPIGCLGQLLIDPAYEAILARFPLPDGFDQGGFADIPSLSLVVLRMVELGLMVPLAEELLFRGGLMRPLKAGRTWLEALVISSLLFCMVHFYWQIALPVLPLALLLGALRLSTGSIVPSLLVHMSFNGFGLALTFYARQIAPRITMPVFIGACVALPLLSALAIFVGLKSKRAIANRAKD